MLVFKRHIDKSTGGKFGLPLTYRKRLAIFNCGCEYLLEFDLDGLKTGEKLSLLIY